MKKRMLSYITVLAGVSIFLTMLAGGYWAGVCIGKRCYVEREAQTLAELTAQQLQKTVRLSRALRQSEYTLALNLVERQMLSEYLVLSNLRNGSVKGSVTVIDTACSDVLEYSSDYEVACFQSEALHDYFR